MSRCSRVCKAWAAYARAEIWREVVCDTADENDSLQRLHAAILETPRTDTLEPASRLVVKLCLDWVDASLLETALGIISGLPCLEELMLQGTFQVHFDFFTSLSIARLELGGREVCMPRATPHSPPPLRALALREISIAAPTVLETILLPTHTPSLLSLHLSDIELAESRDKLDQKDGISPLAFARLAVLEVGAYALSRDLIARISHLPAPAPTLLLLDDWRFGTRDPPFRSLFSAHAAPRLPRPPRYRLSGEVVRNDEGTQEYHQTFRRHVLDASRLSPVEYVLFPAMSGGSYYLDECKEMRQALHALAEERGIAFVSEDARLHARYFDHPSPALLDAVLRTRGIQSGSSTRGGVTGE
ncbi:hypothetical protein JCM10213v2_001454 [Rhodosporidiobolus nylandii]